MSKPYVIGADEVGTGCIAGPIVVCAVRVPAGWVPPAGIRLRDSKQMTEAQREYAVSVMHRLPEIERCFVVRTAKQIDEEGIRRVLSDATRCAIKKLLRDPKLGRLRFATHDVIVDGNMHIGIPHVRSVVKADATVPAVSAASVFAKVFRDTLMGMYDRYRTTAGWNFGKHKGYGTKEHLELLRKYGPTPIHRRTFAPVAELL